MDRKQIMIKKPVKDRLSLTNDGNLQIFFLGVGSAFAVKNFQSNFLIIKGDKHIMVDFGMTAPMALNQLAHLNVTDIECLLPTHSHADHIGGIECSALMNRYVGIPFMKKNKVNMIISEEYQRVLWTHSLQGGLEWNEEDGNGKKLQFSDFFNVIRPKWKQNQPREIFEVNYGDIHLEIFRTKHIPSDVGSWEASFLSFGVFVNGEIFISGDTRFDRDLVEHYADRSLYMFHDVQFFPEGVHASLDNLKTLPDDVKSKMLLYHYGDNWKTQDITGFYDWTEQGVIYEFPTV